MSSDLIDFTVGFLDLSSSFEFLNSGFVPVGGSLFSLGFKSIDQLFVVPSDLGRKVTQDTEFSEAAELDTPEGIRDDLSFDGIIGGGASFENFEFS